MLITFLPPLHRVLEGRPEGNRPSGRPGVDGSVILK
jgi:hypothetical protein